MIPRRHPRDWQHTIELDLLGQVTNLPTAHLLLDLGAGTGDVAARLLARYPGLRVIALEQADLLPPPAPNLQPLRGDAREIPLQNDAVDMSYARFLLQHVPEPVAALRGMARVTRPGGVVAALEVDEGSILLHPLPPGERQRAEQHAAGLRQRGLDRFLGRRLKHLLNQAGLEKTGLLAITITSEQVGMEAFWSIVMTRRGFPAGLPPWARAPGAFGCIVLFLGWGVVLAEAAP